MIATIKRVHCDGLLCPAAVTTDTSSYTLAVDAIRNQGWLSTLGGQWCPSCRDAKARDDALADVAIPRRNWHPELPEPDRNSDDHGVAPELAARAELVAIGETARRSTP